MTLTLVTGPVRSGKSRHAESLMPDPARVLYIATGRRCDAADTADPEWADRVTRHRDRRPASWRTVETADVEGALATAEGPVLIDCLGTWVTAVVDAAGWHDLEAAHDHLEARGQSLLAALTTTEAPVVVVTNEVGWSLVPTTTSGRFFQDELGRLNALVAAASDRVHLVVAGRVLDLTSAPVVGAVPVVGPAPVVDPAPVVRSASGTSPAPSDDTGVAPDAPAPTGRRPHDG